MKAAWSPWPPRPQALKEYRICGLRLLDVDVDIDVDAAEALAGQVDVEQNTASGREKAASTGLDGSCTEVAAEASARSPRWETLTWHAMVAVRSSEQSPQGSLGRSRCGTSALAVEACSQHGPAGDDAYAAEA